MATILKRATKAIQRWNELKTDADLIINYFNQGSFFAISREEYDTWKKTWEEQGKPKGFEIHNYVGLVPRGETLRLALFSIDSYTDSLPVQGNRKIYNEQLAQSVYKHTLKGKIAITHEGFKSAPKGISEEEALLRTQSWVLYKNTWVKALLATKPENMVQLFRMPFSDLVDLFEDIKPAIKNVVMQMSLKPTADKKSFDIDMILWGYKAQEGIIGYPRDFLEPCPPICENKTNYYLLTHALGK